jgi:hypothetical protein
MKKMLLFLMLTGCVDSEPEGATADLPCGLAPVDPQYSTWTITADSNGVMLTGEQYAKVLYFRDRSVAWMKCHIALDRP